MEPEHECEAPAPELPGQLWQCPDCGTRWWADEVDIVDTPVVAWRLVDPWAYREQER
jgi:hypothetical protein